MELQLGRALQLGDRQQVVQPARVLVGLRSNTPLVCEAVEAKSQWKVWGRWPHTWRTKCDAIAAAAWLRGPLPLRLCIGLGLGLDEDFARAHPYEDDGLHLQMQEAPCDYVNGNSFAGGAPPKE